MDRDLVDASKRGDLAAVRQMVLDGYDINEQRGSWTPLAVAASYNHGKVVDLLLELGAKPDVTAAHAQTPLIRAATHGGPDILRSLCDAGADPNVQDDYGLSPLEYAASSGRTTIIQLLIDRGANLSTFGVRALKHAIHSYQSDSVDLLLRSGVLKSACYDTKYAVMEHAVRRGGKEIVRLLIQAGSPVDDSTLAAAKQSKRREIELLIQDAIGKARIIHGEIS